MTERERTYYFLCTILDWTYVAPVTEADVKRALAEVARRLGEMRELRIVNDQLRRDAAHLLRHLDTIREMQHATGVR